MRWLVSVPLVALLASTPASACPAMTMSMRPLQVKNVTMLPDGGVLLSQSNSFGNKPNGKFEILDENGVAIATTEDPIAPGLFRVTPTMHADRELSLAEGGKPLFAFQDAGGAPAIAVVPKVSKVMSDRKKNAVARPPYPLNETTTITLSSAPPKDVVALVLYGADKTPRAWMRTNDTKTYSLWFGGKGCGGVGMSGTVIGEDVMLAYVDSGGRVSAMTKPIRVVRRPPPPKPKVTPVAKPTPPTPPMPVVSKPTRG